MESVWGYDFTGESNVVETLVAGLRRKLKTDSRLIETVWGVGYRFRKS
jgi:DNA-binding response OmpR family regulator